MKHLIYNQSDEVARCNSNQEKSSNGRKPSKTEIEDFNCYKNIVGCKGQDEPNEAQRMEDTK